MTDTRKILSFRLLPTILVALLHLIAPAATSATDMPLPKREFRGAWLHVIGQSQYMNMTPEKQKEYLIDQLDKLESAGCNAVIFQIRPTADALYKSDLEPWSAWLTGKRGKAPSIDWDPLQFIIDESHRRGMELHAWLNPYRVTSSAKEVLPADHLVNREPQRFVKFNGQTFFDPAYEENRQYIANVVSDIVERYDVDAIHFDDYFYPYPAGAKKFDADTDSYNKFAKGKNKGDWRRENVDKLIELVSGTIKNIKPWVRFGISPFGIWRNKSSDLRGSESGGLQNYDDLYADVILWAEKGWIDYLAPQLYWNLDLKVAPTRKLAKWWNDNTPENCDLYIGYDVKRTMDTPTSDDRNELAAKVNMSRSLPNVKGNIWWHGYWVTGNYKGTLDSLAQKHQASLALPPAYGDIQIKPEKVKNVKAAMKDDVPVITWDFPENFSGYEAPMPDAEPAETDVVKFVVYEFFKGEEINLDDPQAIIAVTPFNAVRVNSAEPGNVFIVTAVDRMNRESDPSARLIIK